MYVVHVWSCMFLVIHVVYVFVYCTCVVMLYNGHVFGGVCMYMWCMYTHVCFGGACVICMCMYVYLIHVLYMSCMLCFMYVSACF